MAKKTSYRQAGETFEALRQSLQQGEPASVYLIHGNEQLLIDRAAALIGERSAAGDPSGMNRQSFDGAEADPREIALAASAYPMLGSRRLVIVKDADKLNSTEPIEAYLADPSPTTTLVLIASRPDFRQKLFQAAKERAVLVECRAPYDDKIASWIEAEIASAGRSLDAEGIELLRISAGTSLAELSQELEKLYTYVGARKGITAGDVAAVVGVSRQFSVFDLQRALGSRDARSALAILARMIDAGENMTKCIAQLTGYFEKLWLIPAAGLGQDQAASLLGVRPFFVREYLAARRNFTDGMLSDCFLALRDADLALKSSGGTAPAIMTELLHTITRTPQAAALIGDSAAGVTGLEDRRPVP